MREVSTEVTVLGSAGDPLVDTEVTISQLDHAFGFGNIGFDFVGDHHDPRLDELFLDVFNLAILPFYWSDFEPERGRPRTHQLRAAAEWFTARGVRLKGHPLAWHTLAPVWLLDLPVHEVERELQRRIQREVTDFRGLIDTWDAINETVIMPVFENGDNGITRLAARIGRLGMLRLAFDEARAANPSAELHLNDFDLSPAYENVIEEALAAGIRIDGIGLQTHMHQGYRGEDQVLGFVERFARFGIPLHFTETTLVSGDLMPAHIVDLNDYVVDDWPSTPEGEARQADELERHYRSLAGHPAVHSITYWGLTDEGAWLGAPAGLVRRDATPKPAYERLRSLISGQWWVAPTVLRTDDLGRVTVTGWPGRYAVERAGTSAEVTVAAASRATVTLTS